MITTCALTWDLDTLVLKIRTNTYNIEGNWKYLKFLFEFWSAAWVCSGKKIHIKAASFQGYETTWKGSTSPQEYASLWDSSVRQNMGFSVDLEVIKWNRLTMKTWSGTFRTFLYWISGNTATWTTICCTKDAIEEGGDTAQVRIGSTLVLSRYAKFLESRATWKDIEPRIFDLVLRTR